MGLYFADSTLLPFLYISTSIAVFQAWGSLLFLSMFLKTSQIGLESVFKHFCEKLLQINYKTKFITAAYFPENEVWTSSK